SEETFGHASLFATFTYPPGASIGHHTHDTNMEYYYILSGELTLEENGVVSILKEGDVSVCRDGNGHSIKNHTDKEAKMLALIVEK
ncbi:MAG: cupin domain-containing protein, partial [Oscillospiraceae bacterium]|nr:cupin domain-containing protein [Oscillospiraceae bacterium]